MPKDAMVFKLGTSLQDIENEVIRRALEACGGDKDKTAKMLKIGRATVFRKIKAMKNPAC